MVKGATLQDNEVFFRLHWFNHGRQDGVARGIDLIPSKLLAGVKIQTKLLHFNNMKRG